MSWRAARQRGPEEKKTPAGRTRPVLSGPGQDPDGASGPPSPQRPLQLAWQAQSWCAPPPLLWACHAGTVVLPLGLMGALIMPQPLLHPAPRTHLPPPPLMSWKMAIGGRPASSCPAPTRAFFTAS